MSNECLTVLPESFFDFGLQKPLLKAVENSGYTEPSPIQAEMIPLVMGGRDVIGQAQTGTGKTAAFALPLLNRLQMGKKPQPQVLVLTPTRELAQQVSDSFKKYGAYLNKLKVLAVYGGEEYAGQLRMLAGGVHVVVGTPGRVMDHIRRGTLDLETVHSYVLDEADEMLRMGFLEDVEWILSQAPQSRQVALFSATMPGSILKIAETYLSDPERVIIPGKTATAATISQKYLILRGMKEKREALERILEVTDTDGVLLFVRTKTQTVELAEHLVRLGYRATPLNGDIPQAQRLRSVGQLKNGSVDILVATDVAARGLDVERVSHVINFDIPFDTESYIHRIGRTGRAGRTGEAILLLTPKEKSMLKAIERASRRSIDRMELPTVAEVNRKRVASFKNKIAETMTGDCSFFKELISDYCTETGSDAGSVAAALAKQLQGGSPFLLDERKDQLFEVKSKKERSRRNTPNTQNTRKDALPKEGMERYRIAVGLCHGVKAGNIVGAIANEADLDSRFIGRITIHEEHSTVDLPAGMPKPLRKVLHNARINGKMMKLVREGEIKGPRSKPKTRSRKAARNSRAPMC